MPIARQRMSACVREGGDACGLRIGWDLIQTFGRHASPVLLHRVAFAGSEPQRRSAPLPRQPTGRALAKPRSDAALSGYLQACLAVQPSFGLSENGTNMAQKVTTSLRTFPTNRPGARRSNLTFMPGSKGGVKITIPASVRCRRFRPSRRDPWLGVACTNTLSPMA